MKRPELLKSVRETLSKSGFYVSELCDVRPIGFDLVARRDNSLLILKVLTNIDALSEDVAKELRVLAILLKGCPLLIGERSGTGFLEEEVVYDRFGIKAITAQTLDNHLLEGIPLSVYAAPGGLYVNLDSEKLSNLRRNQNISLGSFARSVRVSRRTVQMYEGGMNARVEVATRIEEFFGSDVTTSIDLLKPLPTQKKETATIHGDPAMLQEFQREIFSLLQHVGYKITPLERCPFEAVSQDKKDVLLTGVGTYDKKLQKRAQIVSSISKITEKYAVLITNKDTIKTNIEGTPLILKRELKKLRGPEEILELIIERVNE
ncbi:MAG: transcriptional regulator [Candidatus Thermoplasmatota archaeon]|nr:transcriptional regulator [Candidatus Thermoplasmatota archaeon]